MVRGDAEALQLSGHETTVGVVPHAGDDAGAMPEARGGDGDVRRAATKELSEGLDIFEVDANLERKMSIPERPIVRMSILRRSRDMVPSSSPLGWPVNLSLQAMQYQQTIVKLCPYNMQQCIALTLYINADTM